MTQGRDNPDRLVDAYLREVASQAGAHEEGAIDENVGGVIREQASANARRRQRRVASLAVVVLLVTTATAVLRPALNAFGGPSPSPTGPDERGLASAQPDSTLSSTDTRAWLARARADISQRGLGAGVLVPILIHVEEPVAYVWFRDYGSGEQILAQYDGADPSVAELVSVAGPSAPTAGPSQWELARIAEAIAGDAALQAAVGPPVTLLSTGVELCPAGVGVCARVRLSGSILQAPDDGPALAPVGIVDMQTLEVSIELPPVMTPETKTFDPS